MAISKRISDIYSRSTVFVNKDILKKGHHPGSLDEVLHRDRIIDRYLTFLKDVTIGKVPDNVLVYGTFGTGKTMLTKMITSELALAVEQQGNKIIVIYIYCETVSAPVLIMRRINKSIIDKMPDMMNKRVGMSKDANFSYFYELVNKANVPILIIFDEIDKLKNPDIINELSRIKECEFTKNNVCIIGVTNDTNFYSNLDGRTKSIIGQNELFIPPYNADELNDILKSRAELAFIEGCYEKTVIPYCSAIGAQENGDARIAIDMLRAAGDIADQRSSNVIEEKDAKAARYLIEMNRQLEVVRGLPTQTKCVLFACVYRYEDSGFDVEMTAVYKLYLKICSIISIDPVTQRRVNDYIGELNDLGILSVNKISRGRRRGVFNSIKPLADAWEIEEIILHDYRFQQLQILMSESFITDFQL
jgi:orc1/cdc6 family replication initiation protein